MIPPEILARWPCGTRVLNGLAMLREGRSGIDACLVRIASPRLIRAGLLASRPGGEAELELYDLLRAEGGDAYSRYNSLLRELVSFEQTMDRYHSSQLAETLAT